MNINLNDYYVIEIFTEDNPRPTSNLLDGLRSISHDKPINKNDDIDDSGIVILSDIPKKQKKKKNKNKNKKESSLSGMVFAADLESDDESENNDELQNETDSDIDHDTLLDVRNILKERGEIDIEDDLTTKGKTGYSSLKKNKNNYKKEFAEELTLLYSLLDETSKFGKSLEKDLNSLKGSKVRGVSKYTNDLAQLILTAKQSKLNILKEITSTKKNIADLTMKSEAKTKDNDNKNNPEYLASAYFKNILMHGRSNFIDAITNNPNDDFNDDYESMIDYIEKQNNEESDEDRYNKILSDRLEANGNPYRSEAGSKYIEYENLGVKIYVKKCIDTGEWEFVAIDKTNQQIFDYPVPTKREAGRMRFSDDGAYATDSKGRIYNVIEYFLPDEE